MSDILLSPYSASCFVSERDESAAPSKDVGFMHRWPAQRFVVLSSRSSLYLAGVAMDPLINLSYYLFKNGLSCTNNL